MTITIKDEKNKTIHRQTVQTRKTTHARFVIPDDVAERARVVDMTATSRGRTDERKGIAWETFRAGGSFELSGGRTPAQSQPRTGERSPPRAADQGATDAAATQAIVTGVSIGVGVGLGLGMAGRGHQHGGGGMSMGGGAMR